MFARNFQTFLPQQARREWRMPPPTPRDRPARRDARRRPAASHGDRPSAATFGMTVIATDPRRIVDGGRERASSGGRPRRLAGRADFVVVTIPHTPRTEGMFDRAFSADEEGRLHQCRPRHDHALRRPRRSAQGGRSPGGPRRLADRASGRPSALDDAGVFTPHTAAYGPHPTSGLRIIRDNLAAMIAGGSLRTSPTAANCSVPTTFRAPERKAHIVDELSARPDRLRSTSDVGRQDEVRPLQEPHHDVVGLQARLSPAGAEIRRSRGRRRAPPVDEPAAAVR